MRMFPRIELPVCLSTLTNSFVLVNDLARLRAIRESEGSIGV